MKTNLEVSSVEWHVEARLQIYALVYVYRTWTGACVGEHANIAGLVD
jgi:hypothetical protein